MRKRKPPYILVSMLIFLGAMLFLVSGGMQALVGGDGHDHETAAAPPTTGEARATDSKEDIAKATKNAVAAGANPSGEPKMMKGQQPSIQLQTPQDYKPVPNDSNISSQWYDDDARVPQTPGGYGN